MAWGANQWVRLTKETTFGTANANIDTGTGLVQDTDFVWVRLVDANASQLRPKPIMYEIRSADGGNRRVQTGSSRTELSPASLTTPFYPTQANFFLGLATTLTANDLGSVTLDHFDSVRVRRYLGCKVGQLKISGGADRQIYTLQLTIQGQKPAAVDPTLAQPASTVFPAATNVPYTHAETKGLVKIHNVVRTNYKSLDLTIANKLAATWDEDQYITSLFYAGRDVDAQVVCQYVAATDRAAYEAVTTLITNQFKWARAGGLATTIDLKSSNYFKDLGDDLPLDNAAYTTLSLTDYLDRTAGTDLSFTVA